MGARGGRGGCSGCAAAAGDRLTRLAPLPQETRAVSREEGQALARSLGTIFFECSAKTKVGVQNAFEELNLKVSTRMPRLGCSLAMDVCG